MGREDGGFTYNSTHKWASKEEEMMAVKWREEGKSNMSQKNNVGELASGEWQEQLHTVRVKVIVVKRE